MSQQSLADLAAKMRGIDIAILSTKTEHGRIASRPMSNNGDVDYDGDSYYFTYEQARTVRDIERDPEVSLAFSSKPGLMGGGGLYVTVEGKARLIRDKAAFKEHWTPDLEVWFERGVDTPGLVLVRVQAERIKFWDGNADGEIQVRGKPNAVGR
jgi:general stress protein 26